MATRVDLKSSHHKTEKEKKFLICVVMNVNWTYCGDHFAVYKNSVHLKLIWCYMSIISQ